MKRIYLDNAATTPVDEEVINLMSSTLKEMYGNPSSIHQEGRKVRTIIEEARKTIANCINASIGEVFFTSCGTESNNMILKNAINDLGVKRFISSKIEHHCVLHTLQAIESNDVQVEYVNLMDDGSIDYNHLEELLGNTDSKTLVTLMHANNELGNLLDLEKVSALCQVHNAYFHTDTVQTMGYYPIDLTKVKINFLAGSAHKFHGPKGVGFVYINNDNQISPYIHGGSQERNMRSGTENVAGIVGMALALKKALIDNKSRRSTIEELKNYTILSLKKKIPNVSFNGNLEFQHYKILSISLPPNPKTDMLIFNMDINGIAVSGGSACSSGVESASHVLSNVYPDSDYKTIRISFSHNNTKEEIDLFIEMLKKSI
jgi:cysteine desulfurase